MTWWQIVLLIIGWLVLWAITGYVQGAAKALGYNDWINRNGE